MKIRLEVGAGRYEQLSQELRAHGIEVDDNATLVLRERDGTPTP